MEIDCHIPSKQVTRQGLARRVDGNENAELGLPKPVTPGSNDRHPTRVHLVCHGIRLAPT